MTQPPAFDEITPPGAATTSIRSVPTTRAGVVRYFIGFALLGFLWVAGFMVIAAVVLPQHLTDLGISNPAGVLGAVNAFGAVCALVANFVVGNLSDRTRSRFGRRTPWILVGTITAGGCLMLIGVLSTPIAIILTFCGFQVAVSLLLAPAVAVLSDRIPQKVRGTASAFYGGGVTIGVPMGSLIGAAFLGNTLVGFVLGGGFVVISGLIALTVWPREPSTKHLPRAQQTLRETIRSFRPPRNAPDFYWAFGQRFFMLISYQMVMAYQLYIVQKYVGQTVAESAKTIATMAVITLVVSVIGSLGAGPLSDLLKRRKLPVVLASLLFAVGIAMPWVFPSTMGMFLFAGIAGFGYGVYTSVDQALLVDVLPDPERAGKDLGLLNLSTTGGQTLGPVITSSIVTLTGSYALIFPVSIASALIGLIFVVRIKHVR
ncbi:MFS transporter [Curtobacterium sp. ISL-83]|uniref:MFS transporter n=1 Tax=Curtobacterium sp. ISL-83 TaxID=2819145 RepID=UPI001BE81934|nr:MFS transporter [Curtobacterium sp. ISL-83]MBT2501718.1 MFS transporter [Curtobacterium sp. ISL-83]